MKIVSSLIKWALVVVVVVGVFYLLIANYSFVFSKTVIGEILEVERVTQTEAILGGTGLTSTQLYSFAVAIRQDNGEIFTASSEDRQWTVAKKGFCVEARFYPYPPWNFAKSGSYFNARLIKLMDCPQGPSSPSPETSPAQ